MSIVLLHFLFILLHTLLLSSFYTLHSSSLYSIFVVLTTAMGNWGQHHMPTFIYDNFSYSTFTDITSTFCDSNPMLLTTSYFSHLIVLVSLNITRLLVHISSPSYTITTASTYATNACFSRITSLCSSLVTTTLVSTEIVQVKIFEPFVKFVSMSLKFYSSLKSLH